jgi:hypothetical protein
MPCPIGHLHHPLALLPTTLVPSILKASKCSAHHHLAKPEPYSLPPGTVEVSRADVPTAAGVAARGSSSMSQAREHQPERSGESPPSSSATERRTMGKSLRSTSSPIDTFPSSVGVLHPLLTTSLAPATLPPACHHHVLRPTTRHCRAPSLVSFLPSTTPKWVPHLSTLL